MHHPARTRRFGLAAVSVMARQNSRGGKPRGVADIGSVHILVSVTYLAGLHIKALFRDTGFIGIISTLEYPFSCLASDLSLLRTAIKVG